MSASKRCFCGELADPRTLRDQQPMCPKHMQPETRPDTLIARKRKKPPSSDPPPEAA